MQSSPLAETSFGRYPWQLSEEELTSRFEESSPELMKYPRGIWEMMCLG